MFKVPTQPITIAEADRLKLFQMTSRTLYRNCHSGKIKTIKINNVFYITPEAVDDYQRSKTGGLTIEAVVDDQIAFADAVIESKQNRDRIKAFLNNFRKHIYK